jgi:putative autotransporter adhesin-like protein
MTIAPTSLHPRGVRYGILALSAVLALVGIVALLVARYGDVGGTSTSSGVRGSGVAASQARRVASFDAVELAGSNEVNVRVGGPRSVVVHADDNLIRHVTTGVRAGTLVIANTPGGFTTASPMSVEVTVPSLHALRLSGSGLVTVVGIAAPRLAVSLPGTGLLRASGTAGRLDVDLGGSGDAELGGLVASHVRATVRGSGRIDVTATRSLDGRVSGSGAIFYAGNPARVTRVVSGSGAIVPG